MYRIFRQLKRRRDDSVEAKLKHWAGWHEKLFRIFTFASIGLIKLRLKDFFWTGDYSELFKSMRSPSRWNRDVQAQFTHYLSEMGFVAALFFSTLFWYSRYKKAVLAEIGILIRLFPDNKPVNWEKISGSSMIPVIAILLPCTFLLLALLVDYPRLFCVVALCLSFMDLWGNIGVQHNLIRYINDPEFAVHGTEELQQELRDLRQAAVIYWLDNPQLQRIFVVIVLEVAAFFLASDIEVAGFHVWPKLCYVVLLVAILGNEAIMASWRWSRDNAIFDAEERNQAS